MGIARDSILNKKTSLLKSFQVSNYTFSCLSKANSSSILNSVLIYIIFNVKDALIDSLQNVYRVRCLVLRKASCILCANLY